MIDVVDPEYAGPGERLGEHRLRGAARRRAIRPTRGSRPADEWDAIALNYTSGTTGNPKGVVYHHRGAYLNALGNILAWSMPRHPVYLWTLPMFHCNGWCFPWTLAADAGTNVCLRKVEPAPIFDADPRARVTHYCGAPIVHSTLINAPDELREGIDAQGVGVRRRRRAARGDDRGHGAHRLRPHARLRAHRGLRPGDGLREARRVGRARRCGERAERNGRQGVRYLLEEGCTVIDPETMQPVPADGETMGEIMFRGNMTMKGYLKNAKATQEAFAGGWFHSGDLAVLQPDGYIKIKDRAKDIIISGGENISSLEVEDALYRHPAVLAAAVVAQPDPKWGETPCAFVELKPGATRDRGGDHRALPRAASRASRCPGRVVFGPLPKTSTGKIQKFVLREQAKSAAAIE